MAVNEKEKSEIVFEIKDHVGVIKTYPNGWSKELNVVVWNNGNPKYDIRDWDQDHEHMSRGITLHADELKKLVDMTAGRSL